jgi:hypothetical protein
MPAVMAERRRVLPLRMLGAWPLDFDELRHTLPAWVAEATPQEVRLTARSLAEVAAFFDQRMPDEFAAWLRSEMAWQDQAE